MAVINCEALRIGTRAVVRLTGALSLATAPTVRTALAKSLVEQPDTLIVDVAGLVVAEPAALSVFLAVARQAAVWPGTPVLICAPDAALAARLAGGGYGRLKVFATLDQALTSPPKRRLMSVSDRLLPVTGASRRARDMATEVCLRWELAELAGPAALVASELVTNAVDHARTMADLRLSLGRRYLMIAVRDGSTAEPRISTGSPADPVTGRGLMLVNATASRWGSLPAEDGKVVWATLALQR